jgi:pimeloyl-ACP methyl ester carboxylesterase
MKPSRLPRHASSPSLLDRVSLLGRSVERRHPPRGVFVRVPGGHLHLIHRTRRETARRRPAVLLHGASANACDMNLELFEVIAHQRPVLAIDRPGHGWSDRPGGSADAAPDRQAVLIEAALRERGLRNCILVAHSWSGGLALNMALRYPGTVGGVVLVGAATHPWPDGVISWYHDLGANRWLGQPFSHLAPLARPLVESAVDIAFRPNEPIPGYVERAAVPLLLRPSQFRANSQDMAALHPFLTSQAPLYPALEPPVTAIVSDADAIVPMEHSVALKEQVPHLDLRVLNGLGHMLQHVAVPEIARAVQDMDSQLERAQRNSLD